jgi:hypothetical protein
MRLRSSTPRYRRSSANLGWNSFPCTLTQAS